MLERRWGKGREKQANDLCLKLVNKQDYSIDHVKMTEILYRCKQGLVRDRAPALPLS